MGQFTIRQLAHAVTAALKARAKRTPTERQVLVDRVRANAADIPHSLAEDLIREDRDRL